MYIVKKERTNKRNENVYYFYLAESKRVNGKVKNTQIYMTNLKLNELNDDELIHSKLDKLNAKFSTEEVNILKDKIDTLSIATIK